MDQKNAGKASFPPQQPDALQRDQVVSEIMLTYPKE